MKIPKLLAIQAVLRQWNWKVSQSPPYHMCLCSARSVPPEVSPPEPESKKSDTEPDDDTSAKPSKSPRKRTPKKKPKRKAKGKVSNTTAKNNP